MSERIARTLALDDRMISVSAEPKGATRRRAGLWRSPPEGSKVLPERPCEAAEMQIRSTPIVLVALAGCSAPPTLAELPRAPTTPAAETAGWWDVVRPKIEAGALAFRVDGDGFVASSQHARLQVGKRGAEIADVALRTVAVNGSPVDFTDVGLGACATGAPEPGGSCVRRVERVSAQATEWWAAVPAGFEQGWTVADTADTVVVDVEVEGGSVAAQGDGLKIATGSGEIRVGPASAWDATGRALPARYALRPGGFALSVEASGAVGPITIDPVYTPVLWSDGSIPSLMTFGITAFNAGDVNGDGYDDVMVGSRENAVAVFHGSSSGLHTDPDTTIKGSSSNFGEVLAGGSDVDGDGYDDVVIGAPAESPLTEAGYAYVYLGSAAGLGTSPATTLTGAAYTYFAYALAMGGDVDGDGYGDLAVCAQIGDEVLVYAGSSSGIGSSATTTLATDCRAVAIDGDVDGDGYDDVLVGMGYGIWGEGRAVSFHGSSTGVETTDTWDVVGTTSMGLGAMISAAGDVDGDGYDDAVVVASGNHKAYVYHGSSTGLASGAGTTLAGSGSAVLSDSAVIVGDMDGDGYAEVAAGEDSSSTSYGGVYLYAGSKTGVSGTPSQAIAATRNWNKLGFAFATGDTNGDGYADLLATAPDANRAGTLLGSSSTLPTAVSTSLLDHGEDQIGYAVRRVGDLNGDGHPEVAVGAPGYAGSTGAVFIYAGTSAGLETTASVRLDGSSFERFGEALDAAGDVNGDGYDDLIVGSPYAGTSYTGKASVFLGAASGIASTAAMSWSGVTSSAHFGYAVAGVGDWNGDTYDDVAVGVESATSGRVYLYAGSSKGAGSTAVRTLSLTGSVFFGAALAGLDVNGDAYGDLVVGAPDWSSTATGNAYVYQGSSSGIGSTPNRTLSGSSAGDRFGAYVADAGDVNGDGYADLAVSATYYAGSTGRVYLYHGASTGIGTTADAAITGTTTLSWFGAVVDAAGDTNADGYGDLVVGAWRWSEVTGAVYVYSGSATGLVTTPGTTLTGSTKNDYFGWSVAGIGDANGDGYDDIMVGALQWEGTGAGDARSGAVYVYQGFVDADGDGYGADVDCDDADPAVTEAYTAYEDADGDGYGDPAGATVEACEPVSGYVADATDCDDADPDVNPGEAEVCDAADVDEDCDGDADDDDSYAWSKTTVYTDADGDGYGGASTAYCDPPSGAITTGGDCDDASASIYPGATEVCDKADADEDCDALTDDDDPSATSKTTYYLDADRDGYGTTTGVAWCDRPSSGYATNDDDCDDTNWAVYPGATEKCDDADVDEDCDGASDDDDTAASGKSTAYADVDGDGFGDASSTSTFCDRPTDYVLDASDCDDTRADVNPDGTEACDADDADEDCNGFSDNDDGDAAGRTTLYRDTDGDGFGGTETLDLCDTTTEYVSVGGDCDDTQKKINPGAAETISDGVDQDCDGGDLCQIDADGDGYRAATGTVASTDLDCTDVGETAKTSPADCDDASASVHGGAEEVVANGIDEDCDGFEVCFADLDNDGYRGDPAATVFSSDLDCAGLEEAGTDTPVGDCDEFDAAIHPGAEEGNCADPVDYNCDGTTGYADADADGFPACQDCDDRMSAVHVGAEELCNRVDDDCDGEVDDAPVGAGLWNADADADGYTDPDVALAACDPPVGYARATELPDCDDSRGDVHPAGVDVPADGVDQDCDGVDAVDPETEGPKGICAPGVWSSPALLLVGLAVRRRRSPRSAVVMPSGAR